MTQHGWVQASSLSPGDRLRTADRAIVLVVEGYIPGRNAGWMWDLSIPGDNDHSFYILAGAVSALVHNDGGPAASKVPSLSGMTQAQADEVLVRYGFKLNSISSSGAYATYVAQDGSKVTIRLSDGRVTRTSVVDAGPNAKNYPQRWGPDGNPTDSHDTGENLDCG